MYIQDRRRTATELVEPALVDVDVEVLPPINVPGSISGIPKTIHGVRRFVRWGVCSRTTDVERLSIIPVVLRLRKGVSLFDSGKVRMWDNER